jgi:DNA-binding PadR family transcriptional regulator
MISDELILLGLLAEKPRHGYEIKKNIRNILSLFAGVEVTSIYYPLTVLEKNGYISKRCIRLGKRPRKFVYELTSRGRQRFRELLSQSLLDFTRPRFSLDVSLYFLHHLSLPVAHRRLRARMGILERLERSLVRMRQGLSSDANPVLGTILEHNTRMVEAERRFLEQLLATLGIDSSARETR